MTRNFDVDKALEETVDPTGSVREEAQDLDEAAHARETEGESEAVTATGASPSQDDAREPAGAQNRAAQAAEPAEPAGATVIKHPVSIAPAHSVTPPAAAPDEGAAAPEDDAAPGSDSSQQRA